MAIARLVQADQMAQATTIGYQAVKVWVMTQNKKRMPAFETLLPKRDGGDQTVQQMRATMQQLAQQYGQKRMRMSTRHG